MAKNRASEAREREPTPAVCTAKLEQRPSPPGVCVAPELPGAQNEAAAVAGQRCRATAARASQSLEAEIESGREACATRNDDLAPSESDGFATREMCAWCFALLCHALHRPETVQFPQGRGAADGSQPRLRSKRLRAKQQEASKETAEPAKPSKCSPATLRSAGRWHDEDAPKAPLSVTSREKRGVRVPMFVSFMITDESPVTAASEFRLRGCIGSLEPVPIQYLAEYCRKAACSDWRFRPIAAAEVPQLQCHVSLLYGFEPCKHPYDWDINEHGIIIKFEDPADHGDTETYQATFLPGVAKEHNMSYKKTLEELIYKAGWRHAIDANLIASLRVTRYKSSKEKLLFSEYLKDFVTHQEPREHGK